MRGFVSSLFNLCVAAFSVLAFVMGSYWMATRQLGELQGVFLLTGYLLAGIVFSYRFLFADFEPLSIMRPGSRNWLLN